MLSSFYGLCWYKCSSCRYFTPKPVFEFTLYGGSYQCTLTLPPNAAFQTLVGPVHRNSHMSKQLVCMDACKKLHQLGALDDRLLLVVEEPLEIAHNGKIEEKEIAAGAGKEYFMVLFDRG